MSTDILAGMIEFEDVADFGGASVGSYDQFNEALTLADALMSRNGNGRELKMFVAPEYYFSGHGITQKGSTTISSLSRSDKHGLYRKIAQSSALFPNILIVPGSIAYSKARGLSKRKYYNVCPIAAKGRIIHKYYKQSNDDFKSKDYGSTFKFGDLRFGIEICLDHGEKKLSQAAGSGTVDVQVLISDGFAPSTLGIVAPAGKGAVVFCDMKGQGNGVLSVFSNKFGNPNTDKPVPVGKPSQTLAGGVRVALYRGNVG